LAGGFFGAGGFFLGDFAGAMFIPPSL